MDLNADFTERVVIHSDEIEWRASPMPGVDRRMLDRIGDEVARATTIVRYAENSSFSPHTHTGGEEFFVLDGVFQDEHGDFPAGSYVRNPPTSQHTPGAENGCTIFVKLWQFKMDDRTQIMIDTNKSVYVAAADRPGVSILPLFQDEIEYVRMEKWSPGAEVKLDLPRGGECLVIEGGFTEGSDTLKRRSWLRMPVGSALNARASQDGATIWIKTGHLPFAEAPKV